MSLKRTPLHTDNTQPYAAPRRRDFLCLWASLFFLNGKLYEELYEGLYNKLLSPAARLAVALRPYTQRLPALRLE